MGLRRITPPVLVVMVSSGIWVGVSSLVFRNRVSTGAEAPLNYERIAGQTKVVSYKGITFTFDSSLASKVLAETIPANTGGQAAEIFPEHSAFSLVGFRRPSRLSPRSREIRIFPLARFRKINPAVDYEVRSLLEILKKRPTAATLNSQMVKAREDKTDDPLPFIPMFSAGHAFVAHIRYVKFKQGNGILFLTQWVTETEQISNEGLEYAFQGITEDGKHYVSAEFPVEATFLPRGDEPAVMKWNEKNYLLPIESKEYQDYLRPVVAKLEALPAKKFLPRLELLEQLIASLEVRAK